MKIRVGIYGYGNLGKGVECAIMNNDDFELKAVFSRREPEQIKLLSKNVPVYKTEEAISMEKDIDVMILCGGSATDLPKQTPMIAKYFNVVDSFDTHAKIPEHLNTVHNRALIGNKTAIISVGWDPGMFSLNRIYSMAVLPNGETYTFWGKGVSQGHSDAIRRIQGVLDAKQYTIPKQEALDSVRSGANPEFSTRQKHLRECFVVAAEDADLEKIKNEIETMPNYFSDYDTIVNFISQDELNKNHSGIPHGGLVIRTGKSGEKLENNHRIEYSLALDSNPEFTAGVLVAYARAAVRMNRSGKKGGYTPFDVAPIDLIKENRSDAIINYL